MAATEADGGVLGRAALGAAPALAVATIFAAQGPAGAAGPLLTAAAAAFVGCLALAVRSARIDRRLAEAERRLRAAQAAAEALPDGLAIFDAEDRIVWFNPRYPEHLAPSLRSVLAVGKRFRDWIAEGLAVGPIYHPEMGGDFLARRFALHEDARADHVHRLVDGRWVRIRESRTPDGGRILLTTDVTGERRRDEERALLAMALEQVGDPVEITDADHRFLYVNRAFEAATGWRREEAAGRRAQEILSSGAHPPAFFEAMHDRLRAGESWQGLIVNRARDGRTLEQETTISPVRGEDGRIAHFVAVKRDVTEARAQARALAESEARYRNVVETQTEYIVRVRPDGRWSFVNDAVCRYLGLSREELLSGRHLDSTFVHPDDLGVYRAHIARITPEAPTHTVEWRGVHPKGEPRWERWTDTGVFDAEGRLVEIQCVGRDITEVRLAEAAREEAERRLAEREAQFRAVAENTPASLVIGDLETGRPLFLNRVARRLVGLGDEDPVETVTPPWEDPAARAAFYARVRAEGAVDGLEADLALPDGRRRRALVSGARIAWEGRPAVLSVSVDVTALRETERALRESEARLAAFMEFAPVAAHLRAADGRYLMLNREMERIFGVSAAQALGRTPADLFPQALIGASDRHHERVVATGERHVSEQHLTHMPEGPYRWVMAIRFPVLDADGRVSAVGTFAVDIAERKAAEAALRASEARLAAIIEANPVPMNIARLADRKLLFANHPYIETFGLAGVDLETFDRNRLYADPADRDRIFAEIAAGRPVTDFALTLRRSDGTDIPASLSSRPILFQGEPCVVTSSVDLTALRAAQAEIARQREALHQSEKLTALGSLLAGVAHELNNPLSVVVGYSSMLAETAEDPALKARVERIHAAAERCARIVRTFLAMARARPPQKGPVSIADVALGALDLAGYGLRSAGVEVTTDCPPDLPTVWGDADQLHQVVTNLIVNAQQALMAAPGPRRLRIRARARGGRVSLIVADTGPGMSPEVAARAFEPFFTTKPQGVGTGVGLSVCHGIVAAHGGRIDLETSPGRGARFRVLLPVGEETAATAASTPARATARGVVLVVDDEPDIADLVAETLRAAGFEAETATGARRALAALSARSFDAVVTDLRMPDMDGAAFAEAACAARPSLAGRIAFVTGDALGAGAAAAGRPVFEKPLDLAALTAAVARMAAGGAP